MRRAKTNRGRIEEHAHGLGTPTPEMVQARAREIAITRGRLPEQFDENDLDQAREELQAAHELPEAGNEAEPEVFVPKGGPAGSSGRREHTRRPSDEQTFAEQLVEEGVEEAAHEQMKEGNQESRRRDQNFEEQTPSSE